METNEVARKILHDELPVSMANAIYGASVEKYIISAMKKYAHYKAENLPISGVRVSDEEDDFDDSDESIDWCSYCGDEPKLNGKDYCKGCKAGVDWMK